MATNGACEIKMTLMTTREMFTQHCNRTEEPEAFASSYADCFQEIFSSLRKVGVCLHLYLKKKLPDLSTDFIRISSSMTNVSQTMETEEDLLTLLHIKFYHPQQHSKGLYDLLPLGTRSRRSADDPLRLGHDAQACTYSLVDPKVSRKQLALNAFYTPKSPDMLFSIQNLSQRGRLSVNGSSLGYLERMDLPDKALIRFLEYEMLIIRESGEAKTSFEVDMEVMTVPPSRETCTCVPGRAPVMDTGMVNQNTAFPQETDETLLCYSN